MSTSASSSSSSTIRNGNSRAQSKAMVMIIGVLTIALLMSPLSTAVGIGGIGFASAFTTSTTTTGIRTRTASSPHLHGKHTARRQASINTEEEPKTLWTLEQLEEYAADETINVVISFTTFGPVYRAVARAKHDESIVLGYVEGFLRPTQPRLLHLDKMEIFQKVIKRVRRSHPNTLNFGGVNIGLGLMMGYRCLLYAAEPAQGPRTIAEFLAIDDEDFQHKRLVRYYRYAGFKIVKYVGEDAKDIPDRLVWGGCGTLMKQDIPELMAKWTKLFVLMKTRVAKEEEETKNRAEAIGNSSDSESESDTMK